jgi:hypothetical protein
VRFSLSKPKLAPVALVALVACIPFAPAAEMRSSVVIEVHAAGVTADGEARIWGTLGAFDAAPAPGSAADSIMVPAPRTAPSSMVVHANSMTVRTDAHADNESVAARIGVGAAVGDGATWTKEDAYSAAAVSSPNEPAKPKFAFFVAASPGHQPPKASLEGTHLGMAPAGSQVVTQKVYVPSGHAALGAAIEQSVKVAPSTGWQRLVISGDFAVMVWEWNLDLAADGKSALLKSGSEYQESSATNGAPAPVYGSETDRQVYLFVENGTLEFTFAGEPTADLYLQPAGMSVGGTMTLQAAGGTLHAAGGDRAVQPGETVTLRGVLSGQAGPVAAGAIPLLIGGQVDEARIGSDVVPMSALPQSAASASGPSGWFAAVALAAAGAAGAGWWARRRSLARTMASLRRKMDDADYAPLRAMPAALLRSRRFAKDAHALKAVASLRLGDAAAARSALEGWPEDGNPSVRDYMFAHLACLGKDWAEAATRLRSCLARNPEMGREIASNPVFAPVLGRLERKASHVNQEGYI